MMVKSIPREVARRRAAHKAPAGRHGIRAPGYPRHRDGGRIPPRDASLSRSCARRSRGAAGAISTGTPRRPSSARAHGTPRSCSSASSRETRRTSRAIRSSGRPDALLDEALEQAGIDRAQTYVTNAVKHFKWQPRGKRRIHQKPSWSESVACRPWLEAELELVRPRVLVALGATAAQSLLGRDFRVTRHRGELLDSQLAEHVTATIHPSAILRQQRRTVASGRARRVRRRPQGRRCAALRSPARSRDGEREGARTGHALHLHLQRALPADRDRDRLDA